MDLRTILSETITEMSEAVGVVASKYPDNAYLHYYRYIDQLGALHKVALKADLDDIATKIADDIEIATQLAAANATMIANR